MKIEDDVFQIIQSLLQISNKEKFETDIYSSSDPRKYTPTYQHQESIEVLKKSGVFLSPPQKTDYAETMSEYSVMLKKYPYYHVMVSRKKAVNYLLDIIDSKPKELLGDGEQLRKVITIIFDKQLKFQNKQVLLSFPFIDDDEFKNVQLIKTLKRLKKMGLIKIVAIDVLDDKINFTVKGLDKLEDIYREKGRYIEKGYLGNPMFHLDPLTGDYKWDKVTGVFDSLESYQLKIFIILLESPNKPIRMSEIYERAWNKDLNRESEGKVKNNLRHLRKRLGISGRKDNKPGNIDRKYNMLMLYL